MCIRDRQAPGSTETPELDETTSERSNSAHWGAALPSVAETMGAINNPASRKMSKRGRLMLLQTSISAFKLPQTC